MGILRIGEGDTSRVNANLGSWVNVWHVSERDERTSVLASYSSSGNFSARQLRKREVTAVVAAWDGQG